MCGVAKALLIRTSSYPEKNWRTSTTAFSISMRLERSATKHWNRFALEEKDSMPLREERSGKATSDITGSTGYQVAQRRGRSNR